MQEYNKKDIKAGMRLRCTDNGGWEHWTTGKVYNVFKNMMGLLVIQSDTGGQREVTDIVQYLNGVAKAKFELLNEEEKEVTKYAKITKYFGRFNTDKRNGLEIGKEYEIVRFSDDSKDYWVYINDKRPVPLIEVDTLKLIEAKIEQLANEQTKLRNKRMRIKHQEEALRDKRMKLKEAKKSLEFLKQQNYL